jgi:hypothetical protein
MKERIVVRYSENINTNQSDFSLIQPQSRQSAQSIYIYRVQSSVWRLPNCWPPTPSPPSECVLPPHQSGGGYTLAGRWGGGGPIFRKRPDIGLASYSIIPLRQSAKLFSSRRNWTPPTPYAQARMSPPPPVPGGGAHSLARAGVGESQFQRGVIWVIHFGTL